MSFEIALVVGELAAIVLAVLSVPSVLLERKGRPLAATIWLLFFLFLPFVGVLLWWSTGRLYMRRRRRRRRRAQADVVSRLTLVRAGLRETRGGTGKHPLAQRELDNPRAQARELVFGESDRVFPSRGGNQVRLLVDGAQAYPALFAAIAAAREHIHFQFYIYQDDETGLRFRDALVAAAQRGVTVRVLVDAVGGAPILGEFMDPLRAAGGYVESFLPFRFLRRRLTLNFRNHRKIVVVDGRLGYIGGLNIGSEYLEGWHDLGLFVEGPAVDQLQEVFALDWYFACSYNLASAAHFGRFEEEGALALDCPLPPAHTARCRVIASGPDTLDNATFQVFFLACTTATRRIWLMTPYFIPDQAMLVALTSAAQRGVDVRLMVPQRSDVPFVQLACRSYYEELLAAGVQIYEFVPAVLHAKMLLFDHDWTMMGSANVDIRSFRLNFEASVFMEGAELNAHLASLFEADQANAVAVTLEQVRALDRLTQIKQAAAHLFSPLL